MNKAIALYKIMMMLELIDAQAAFAVRLRLAGINNDIGVCMADTALAAMKTEDVLGE